ncbi:beta carbonic anhydrase 1-like isoform X1 [Tachypleus tridentatus]|uniref:beta carbonic anhydrase 1-like isoform X1 n=2 Tax=Tachypleus tridentatus TaxID=6853 RepID=UPI003FD276BE
MGLETILRGIVKYRKSSCHSSMLQKFQHIKEVYNSSPRPSAIFVTCMDSRISPSQFTQTEVGDMFVVRNAGNLVPSSSHQSKNNFSSEPAAMELACVLTNVRHVVICGHSDCKAMNRLYRMYEEETLVKPKGLLDGWLCQHGEDSLQRYIELEKNSFKKPLEFFDKNTRKKFRAFIDPDDRFRLADKLSQVNCLQQLENVTSHAFLTPLLLQDKIRLHAIWFDVNTGEVHFFSKKMEQFVEINDHSVEGLLEESDQNIFSGPNM